MNLQQLRYLCAVVDHGLNVSVAAEALFTSQPGISKQIRQLEDELGVPIFIRQGKRLTALTAGGEIIVATARRALQELSNLKRVGAEFKSEDTGTLSIATTHTQARYVLPPVLKRFSERYPKVRQRPGIRRFIVKKRFKVFYRVQHDSKTVEILRCWDGRRETDPSLLL